MTNIYLRNFFKKENYRIQLAVGKSAQVTEIRKKLIIVLSNTGKTYVTLNNILCVPEPKCDLILTSKAPLSYI